MIYWTNRFGAWRLFSNRSQIKSKCGKSNKSLGKCVTDDFTAFSRLLWSVTEQMLSNMESICFYTKMKWKQQHHLCICPLKEHRWRPINLHRIYLVIYCIKSNRLVKGKGKKLVQAQQRDFQLCSLAIRY